MNKTIEQILVLKPEARPRIYAYSIADKAHAGLLKVGQTVWGILVHVLLGAVTVAVYVKHLLPEFVHPFPLIILALVPFLVHPATAGLIKSSDKKTDRVNR